MRPLPTPFPPALLRPYLPRSPPIGASCMACSRRGCSWGGVVPHAMTGGALGGSKKGTRTTWCELGWFMRWAMHNAILGFMFLQEGDGNRYKTLRVTDPNNEILRTVMSPPSFFGLKLWGWTFCQIISQNYLSRLQLFQDTDSNFLLLIVR